LPLIKTYKEDTNKVKAITKLCYAYCDIDHIKGIKYGNEALLLAKKLHWNQGIALSYSVLGSNYWACSDYVSSLEYQQKALKIYEELKDYKKIIMVNNSIASTNFAQGNLKMALAYYFKSLELAEKSKAESLVICGGRGILCNISMTYMGLTDYENCILYLKKSLAMNIKIQSYPDIALVRRYIGETYINKLKYNEALPYIKDSYVQFMKLNKLMEAAYCQDIIADVLDRQEQYDKAIAHYKISLLLFKKDKEIKSFANTLSSIGRVYFHNANKLKDCVNKDSNDFKSNCLLAIKYLKKAILIAAPIDDKINVAKMKKDLSDAYLLFGDYKRGYEIFKDYLADKDSLYNTERDKVYTRKLLDYDFQKKADSIQYSTKLKNAQIENLNQKNKLANSSIRQQWLIGILLLSHFLLVLITIVYNNKIKEKRLQNELLIEKNEKQLKEAEYKNKLNELTYSALRSQMNPHFIFNCLNSIRLYTEENNNDKASFYLHKFSKLIRLMLDSNSKESISVGEEIQLITLYLEMEKMRLKNKLQFNFKIDDKIDIDFIKLPPLLLQPYIENSIWHGIMPKATGGNIDINFALTEDENYLHIQIIDNGVGRMKAAELKEQKAFKHISHGTRITGKRIDLINEQYQSGASIKIEDLLDVIDNNPTGTRVTITIPV